jgi:DUF1009 family protein
MISSPERLAIIAGAGKFPFLVAEGAKRAGCELTILGLRGFADASIASLADQFRWAGIARMGGWIRTLKRRGVHRVILAGSVTKADMYGRFRILRLLPDLTSIRIWFFRLADKRNDAVLAAVADEFARHGITMEECVKYTPEHMVAEGVLTRRQPSAAQRRDAEFGWRIAKEMGRLDIGQSVAVKETEVIAVEAIEGTDRMIERAGALVKSGGWTLVKVAKPNQDMRFDVPTIGPQTIAMLSRNGASMLAVEAGKTVIIDREETLSAAERAGMVILAMAESA